jgi:hypothetical protein
MPILIHGNSKVPEFQQKNVKSTTVQQEITPSEGYDGFDKIIVSPIKLQEKPATPSTSEQVITPDSTYDGLSKVTVEAVKSVVQATPAITVATDGLITALATQSEGYVSAGTKSATNQMTTQKGKDVYPGTTRQLVVPAWRYTIGNIYVNGDSNLTAGNIKKGVSIFGVSGSYEGASSGSNDKVKVFSGTASPYSKSTLGISLNENVSGYSLKMVAVAMTKSDANASLNGVISYSRFPESAQSIAVCGVYGNSYDEFLVYGDASFEESVTNTTFVLSISSTNSYRMFNTGAQYNYLLVYKSNEIEIG